MTKVLVSVRDADEATLALQAGVDLIDLKEPRRGALGPVAPDVVAQAIARIAGAAPLSMALGELRDMADPAGRLRETHPGVSYVKIGLAGCETELPRDWRDRWQAAASAAPPHVRLVAVCYADWRTCGAPSPGDVLAHGLRLGCRAVLVDTFDKGRGDLFAAWSGPDLRRFCARIQAAGAVSVLAGSLNLQSLRKVLPWRPDYAAFRGAACAPSREGAIDPGKLAELVLAVGGQTAMKN